MPVVRTGQRRYLPSSERKEEILDAAFEEFSETSYNGTTIERIATRAGLSKAGIYAHFQNKEEIFGALMERFLIPKTFGEDCLPMKDVDLDTFVDIYLGHMYALVENPAFLKVFRLLMTESERTPELVARWREGTVVAMQRRHQAFIDAYVAQGAVRASALTENFWPLSIAPLSTWVIAELVKCPLSTLAQTYAANRTLLLELLRPQ
ncbi:TetR/AcrR family transcriptional regulator [Pseudomonas aeruginosa]|uniref:TetR/AcrR family transcriptional regulator n=1 Tax=Pseudomonas aeruginosa TaxID=287 RepID=UPI00053E6BB3|nr:TetR/AcrR family transcriptional regulator [Pseudomonas aeruginosa]HBN9494423.1 TetR/AcrR family transcriptional regulator [Pseudomonas aeruginosa]